MLARSLTTLALLLALAAPAAASPVRLLGTPGPGAWPVLLLGGATARTESALDREAIYAILCGGQPAADPSLRAHLWKVAGSLATRSWIPPKVTIRVVVQPAR